MSRNIFSLAGKLGASVEGFSGFNTSRSSFCLLNVRFYEDWIEARKPPDPTKHYTSVEESKEDFRYVERLLGSELIPRPPLQAMLNFPTPSGWVPPAAKPPRLPYFVGRSRFHNLPVYLEIKEKCMTKKMTKILKVEGDIWKFHDDLRGFLKDYAFDDYYGSQVDEIGRKVRVKGDFVEPVKKFLIEKGF